MNRILVGLDGSKAAQAALDFAADLAAHYGAELHVVSVAELPEIADDIETEAIADKAESATHETLATIPSRYPDLVVITAARVGHAAEHLLRYADGNQIDHIVLGHRGRSFFDRWLLGSVSRKVVAYANCTVTITRPR